MEDEGPIKANWGKLSKKFFKSIILDIIEDITATKEELIYKYAVDKEFAASLISKSSDSHNLANQIESHQFSAFSHHPSNNSDCDMQCSSEEDNKSQGGKIQINSVYLYS